MASRVEYLGRIRGNSNDTFPWEMFHDQFLPLANPVYLRPSIYVSILLDIRELLIYGKCRVEF